MTGKFANLSEIESFTSGYIVVRSTLFEVDDGTITDAWDLEECKLSKKIAEARAVADLEEDTLIVIDDEGVYDPDILEDEGRLLTAEEAFDAMDPDEQDGWNDIVEYYSNQ